MKKNLALVVVLSVMMLASVADAGVAGRYALDKKPLIERMKKRIAKLPPKRRGFANMAIMMISGMKMFIDLADDKRASMSLDMAFFGRRRQNYSVGTWSMAGDVLTVKLVATKGRGKRPPRKQTLTCKVKGKRIACENSRSRKKEIMYFDQVSTTPQIYKPTAKAPAKKPYARKTADRIKPIKLMPAFRAKAPAKKPSSAAKLVAPVKKAAPAKKAPTTRKVTRTQKAVKAVKETTAKAVKATKKATKKAVKAVKKAAAKAKKAAKKATAKAKVVAKKAVKKTKTAAKKAGKAVKKALGKAAAAIKRVFKRKKPASRPAK